MPDHFDPYYAWLGIPPEEQPADYYRLLGVRRFESNEDVISNAADQRMTYLHTFQVGKRSQQSQKLLNEIAASQACLLDRAKRAAYDEQLRRVEAAKVRPTSAPVAPVSMMPAPIPAAPRPLPVARPLPAVYEPPRPVDPATVRVSAAVDPPGNASPLASPTVLIAAAALAASLVLLVGGVAYVKFGRGRPVVATNLATSGDSPAPTKPPPTPPVTPVVSHPQAEVPPETSNSATPSPAASSDVPPSPPTEPDAANPAPAEPLPPIPAPPPPAAADPPPAAPKPAPVAGPAVIDKSLVRQTVALSAPQHWAEFSPDGRVLVLGLSRDTGLYVIDTFAGELDHAHQFGSRPVGFGRDGNVLAMTVQHPASKQSHLEIRGLGDGRRSKHIANVPLPSAPLSLAWSDDDRLLFLAGGNKGKLGVLNARNKYQPLAGFETKLPDVSWLAVQGDALVCAATSGQLEQFSIRTKRSVGAARQPGSPVYAQMLVPKDKEVRLLCFDALQAISLDPRKAGEGVEYSVPLLSGPAAVLALSPDGDLAAVRTDEGLVLWDIVGERALTTLVWQEGKVEFAALGSGFGRKSLATSGPQDHLVVWDLDALLKQPKWLVPSRGEWAAGGYPEALRLPQFSNAKASAARVNANPNLPGSRVPAGPREPTPEEWEAARAAIAALQAMGVQVQGDPQNVFVLNPRDALGSSSDGHLIARLPRLQVLDLQQHPGPDQLLKGLKGSPVMTLLLGGPGVKDEDLAALKDLPRLRNLQLNNTQLTPACLVHLRNVPELRSLGMPHFWPREAVAELSKLTQLEQLQNFPRGITEADFELLCQMKNLKELSLHDLKLDWSVLRHIENLTNLETVNVPRNLPPAALAHFSGLNLNFFSFPLGSGDAELAHFARMSKLRILHAPPEMTDEGMKILGGLSGLTNLYMDDCRGVTDAGLAHLEPLRLQNFNVPPQITDAGLKRISTLGTLHSLTLKTEAGATNQGLAPLANLHQLQHLHLGQHFGDGAARHLAHLDQLQNLALEDSKFTASGFSALLGLPRLRNLNLMNIPLGPDELDSLGLLSQLAQLSIQRTTLTPEQLAALKGKLPKCQIHAQVK